MKNEFLFCPLGGSGEIGMNMNLFAYGKPSEHKWIMVDIGVTFADDSLPGIDVIFPDPGFIVDRKEDLDLVREIVSKIKKSYILNQICLSRKRFHNRRN